MPNSSTGSLLFRNFFFTILQPGIVTGLIPYLIVRKRYAANILHPQEWNHFTGIILFLPGLIILLHCILRFAFVGKGTLSPADPTKHLVATGLYRYSRNPMYAGVLMMLIGECLYFFSWPLVIYTLMVFILFYLFILLHEEPRLRRDFGEEYIRYCERVRRWV